MSSRVQNHVTGRLSLRPPQAESLARLVRALETAPEMLGKDRDVASILATLKAEFPTLEDFERDFPSLCFALATGVGKTRLMGAFVAYLHLAHGINNFFVLAPNLTIYNKLIADFTPNTPKYVFKGIGEFAINAPRVITGDNYDQQNVTGGELFGEVRINIFNISKINSEVRGGKEPRIKRMREVLGESYFNHLANLPDLVLLMDESHRYRAQAGMRAINELNPLFGLEVTATPFVESAKAPIPFKNVVMDYPLARAMEDGFVKEPAVVTQRNFKASNHAAEQIETIKLEDGVRLHEATKVELLTYARENGVKVVKPFILVIARDTTHAGQLKARIEEQLFGGRYLGKVIQVDSSRTGAEEEKMIEALLNVENPEEPTEIVIHVNMLKEGWDVTNLYTIVPLRAANARTLIEQSIGRGLRLPYGKRTGVAAVDRLNIVAHDKFQEIIDEALRQPDALERLPAAARARIKQLRGNGDDHDPGGPSGSTPPEGRVPITNRSVEARDGIPKSAPASTATVRTVEKEVLKEVHTYPSQSEVQVSGSALPIRFQKLPQDQQQILMARLRGLALEQRQAVLAEWDARCASGVVHNAIAYLYGLIKKAVNGMFKLWAARKPAPQQAPAKAPSGLQVSPPAASAFPDVPAVKPASREVVEQSLAQIRQILQMPAKSVGQIIEGMAGSGVLPTRLKRAHVAGMPGSLGAT
jgi:superfamily II DNA or RNA helicase